MSDIICNHFRWVRPFGALPNKILSAVSANHLTPLITFDLEFDLGPSWPPHPAGHCMSWSCTRFPIFALYRRPLLSSSLFSRLRLSFSIMSLRSS